MGFEKLQNINDLDSQEILRDLYFNYITANPLSFWKGVRRSPYYTISKDIVKINIFLVKCNKKVLYIQLDQQKNLLCLKQNKDDIQNNEVLSIPPKTRELLETDSEIASLFTQLELDETQISTFILSMKAFDKYVSSVLTAQTIEIEEKRIAITQFMIPLFTLFISIISLIVSYYSFQKESVEQPKLNINIGEIIRKFFEF